MASRKIDAEKVVWLAPETLHRQALAEKLAGEDDPDRIADLLVEHQTTDGQYREYLGDEPVEGPDGTTVLAPKYGDLIVWVDDSPDNQEDNEGHFERYDGDEADYRPLKR